MLIVLQQGQSSSPWWRPRQLTGVCCWESSLLPNAVNITSPWAVSSKGSVDLIRPVSCVADSCYKVSKSLALACAYFIIIFKIRIALDCLVQGQKESLMWLSLFLWVARAAYIL